MGLVVVGKRTHVQAGENVHGNATLEEFPVSKDCKRVDYPECCASASVSTIRMSRL